MKDLPLIPRNEGIKNIFDIFSNKKINIGDTVEFKNVLDEIYTGEVVEFYDKANVYKIRSTRDYKIITNLVKKKDIIKVVDSKETPKEVQPPKERPIPKYKKPEPPPKLSDYNPQNIQEGDYVKIINSEDLSKEQTEYVEKFPYFRVKNLVPKVDEIYIEIGYKAPLKISRFEKIENPAKSCKYKILFLQFDNNIDTMGEKDKENFFRGHEKMSDLFIDLFDKKLDDIFVNFSNYDDIYKIGNSYIIQEVDMKDYDFVFFGFMSSFTTICKLLLDYLNKHNVPYIKYGNFKQFDNKAYEYELIQGLGLPYIPSVLTSRLTNDILESIKEFGYPLIVKDVTMNQGKGIQLAKDEKGLREAFRWTRNLQLIQKFIENDGEYRVILVSNEAVLVAKKDKIKEVSHKTIKERKSKKGDLPKEVLEMCEEVSKYLFCDIVGIDVIQDVNTGQYYIMEMNSSPHLAMFSVVTGVNIPEIITEHIITAIKK